MIGTPSGARRGVIALLPFLVKGALSLIVLREMRRRGLDVTIAYYMPEAVGYTRDPLEDFAATGHLLDFTRFDDAVALAVLKERCESHDVGLLLQIGSPAAYHQIPDFRQRCPSVSVVDILYNPVGHVVNHFLYERAFDGVIVESQAMERFYAENSVRSDPTIHLVESGIDLEHFAPAVRGKRPLTVAYVGRLSPEKNPVGFIRMVEAVYGQFPGWQFEVYGEGAMEAEICGLVEASPAGSALVFRGYAETARQAFQNIDVLVVPSLLDGRPNAIMEANACGVPVVAAPVGGIPELIEEDVNGALVAPSDHERFAAVLRGWGEGATLERLARSARATAERRFDRAGMMDRYELVLGRYL